MKRSPPPSPPVADPRIGLLITGQAKGLGLPDLLQRTFPQAEFLTLWEIQSSRKPHPGFTSASVASLDPDNPRTLLRKLIQHAAGALTRKPRDGGVDYVLFLDDLELENQSQPALVCSKVRQAASSHLEHLAARNNGHLVDRTRRLFQERLSFHLAAPMLEAWFFADPNTLGNHRDLTQLTPGRDPEDLRVEDPAYLESTPSECPSWLELTPKKQKTHRPSWIRLPTADRTRHPKAYLAWLHREPQHKKCSTYRETHEGADMLRKLQLSNALTHPAHMGYLRALVLDLCDMLELEATPWDGHAAPETARLPIPNAPPRVLRNL